MILENSGRDRPPQDSTWRVQGGCRRFCISCTWLIPCLLAALLLTAQPVLATDFFLTIGGGYEPEGNQASLEANVVFFQAILTEQHRVPRRHNIFFADGHDPVADLQIVADKPIQSPTPATDLLAALHRQNAEFDVTYRNHEVRDITGALNPNLIRSQLDEIGRMAREGDRLIIYVTAHGSEGPERDGFNTSIDCWNEESVRAREFAGWLDKLPAHFPVVMVMAQCYCGGFARTIFRDLDPAKGLAAHPRIGFFAQQHDLPAAGCRPDIEHDEEFSSYFWGALAGRSRNGVPIKDSDIDGNGIVTFAEAYAHAVTAGETIDIPLRTSEVFLRTYSRLADKPAAGEVPTERSQNEKTPSGVAPAKSSDSTKPDRPPLATLTGSLQSFADRGGPVLGRIVTRLSRTLGFNLGDDVQVVLTAEREHQRSGRNQGRRGGRRQGSGRRELLREVAAKWPELGDPERWRESALLLPDNQKKLQSELQQLPSWKSYEERLKQRTAASKESEVHELRAVKFRRLINALEMVVLEQNLRLVATPEIAARYHELRKLEESTLGGSAR